MMGTLRRRVALGQRGGASLLAVAFASLLIMVLILGMARLMTGELRQAIDTESGTKAYYRAISASEEASAFVKNNLARPSVGLGDLNQACDSTASFGQISAYQSPGLSSADIPCVRILAKTTGSNIPPFLLKYNNTREQTKEFDLSGVDFDTIDIKWATDSGDDSGQGVPLIEASLITYESVTASGNTTNAGTTISSLILDPATICGPDPCLAKAFFHDLGVDPLPGDLKANVSALTIGEYSRHTIMIKPLTLVAPPANRLNTVLRLRTRNNSARLQLGVYKGITPAAGIVLQDAIVDVTAKFGDSYRRAVTEVPIRATPYSGFGDVIYSETNICKDLELLTAPGFGQSVSQGDRCPIGPVNFP